MVNRVDVQEMIGKVDFVVDDRAEAAGYHKMTTYIEIETVDGRTVSGVADFGKGSPSNPMTYNEVGAKFLECAEFAGWDKARAERIVSMVAEFETLPSLDSLTAELRT